MLAHGIDFKLGLSLVGHSQSLFHLCPCTFWVEGFVGELMSLSLHWESCLAFSIGHFLTYDHLYVGSMKQGLVYMGKGATDVQMHPLAIH